MKGLANLGNTCYLNSALQCLLYAPPLTNYVLSGLAEQDLYRKRVNACALATEYISLTKAYWGSTDPACLDTRPLWTALAKLHRPFGNSEPHDAHEALVLLLRHLHDALAKAPRLPESAAWQHADQAAWEAHCAKTGYSVLTELFQGQMECAVACGEHRSVTHEHFVGVSVDLEGCSSVQQALARSMDPVRIAGYQPPGGGEVVDAEQTKRITYAPLILVVHLKRFDASGAKVDRFLDYSTDLDLPGGAAAGGGRYALFAACFHRDGHYAAACEVHGHWFLMDDSAVTRIEVNSVVQKDAYMLLYKKVLA